MASKDSGISPAMQFFVGGLGGISGWLFIHPVDVLKVRMQLAAEGAAKTTVTPGQMIKNMLKTEGALSFYKGLSAGLMRQATYTTLRLGLYPNIRDFLQKKNEDSFLKKATAGLLAGAGASFLSCPVEVALVRMQADGRMPAAERRNYKGVFNALVRVGREEGITTYWRGAMPTVLRAMVVNVSQVATYDQLKFTLKHSGIMKDGIGLHLTASTMAAFIYSVLSLPFDTTKTRMQNQKPGTDGKLPYRGTFQTLGKIAAKEGLGSLWRGFIPYFCRGGGTTILTFIFMEQYISLVKKFSPPPTKTTAAAKKM
eukprot:TRINITY_DN7910_c0_g1_i1.p1 TRINITY_DN7910_c0_g1~~TRINITY_DN7910_c0_g1_i1.p1  ORF type:complete len:312 (-),score=54.82 TRINITY_DN7910_c0_g1_i1:17-952(-)